MAVLGRNERERARDLLATGMSYRKIAALLGVTPHTIRYWCDPKAREKRLADAMAWTAKRRVLGRKPFGPKRPAYITIAPQVRAAAEAGATVSEIAAKLRVCKATVYASFGYILKRDPTWRRPPRSSKFEPLRGTIVKLYREGCSAYKISLSLNVPHSCVEKFLEREVRCEDKPTDKERSFGVVEEATVTFKQPLHNLKRQHSESESGCCVS